MPIRTIAPGTPAGGTPLRAYEIDLAGSGGTLSNGTVSLGGYDWTLAGVGTSTLISLDLDLTDLYADYDGSVHSVEICAYVSAVNMAQSNGVSGIGRLDSTATYRNELLLYEFGGNAYVQASSRTDTDTDTTAGRQRTSTYTTFKRWGLLGIGGMTVGTLGPGSVGAFRAAAEAHNENVAISDQEAYTERFGTGDIARLFASRWTGAGVAASASQAAGGVTITFGSQTTTFQKLYVYIGTPETA